MFVEPKSEFDELENDIKSAYEGNVTVEDAEKLAAKFLGAMFRLSSQLAAADLDSRMRKTGVKAIRAAIYLEEATRNEKKPSDVMLSAVVDKSKLVQDEQNLFDTTEVERDNLERYYNIFKEAHLYFRALAKGRFE
jgi:hypothetical protein